jgi:hypothetical protein
VHARVRSVLFVLFVLSVLALAGCGDVNHPPDPQAYATDPTTGDPAEQGTGASPASRSIAFDGYFEVEEGVWWFGRDLLDLTDDPTAGQRNGLLGASGGDIVSVYGPALWGRYRVQVRELAGRPPVPDWCQDVVEVSYTHAGGPLVMGGFEDQEPLGRLGKGSYRLRLCAEGLDRTAVETEEDEFVGEGDDLDYKTYSSRHLFQLWPAPVTPDAVLRVGSDFAREAHAGVKR